MFRHLSLNLQCLNEAYMEHIYINMIYMNAVMIYCVFFAPILDKSVVVELNLGETPHLSSRDTIYVRRPHYSCASVRLRQF